MSGFHRLELLEEFTAYRPEPYFSRAQRSIDQLPADFRDAALAIFANVTYLHTDLLNSTHKFLWRAVKEQARILDYSPPSGFSDIALLEVDPSGLSVKFAQENLLSGRLNADQNTRVEEVYDALRALEDACDVEDTARRREARTDLFSMASRQHWVVLTDKALSGQSLKGDIEKYLGLRRILSRWAAKPLPHVYICAQVMTSNAHQWVTPDVTPVSDWAKLSVIPAILFDERMKVDEKLPSFFLNVETWTEVKALCEWFDAEILATDSRFDDVRDNGGGSLAYGYRASGILLADANNTPTNSLPVLWYESGGRKADCADMPVNCPFYEGPFPRTNSRIGPESPRSTRERWAYTLDGANESTIVKLLGEPQSSQQ